MEKHRHKWEQDYCDCPNCGYSGMYFVCECGDVRDYKMKPFD